MIVKKLAFIGAGNMAGAIIKGLIEGGYPAEQIRATTRSVDSATQAARHLGIAVSTDNQATCQWAEVIVLAVKPQMLKDTCAELSPALENQLIISVAAGIDTATLSQWLGKDLAIVRSMPNTPSQVGVGASGLFANPHTRESERDFAHQVAEATGLCIWVEDETLIHAVTAVSGSGPAYYFLFMEAMIEAGKSLGLDETSARALTLQTALGAATLANKVDTPVDQLKRNVMSPGGTTERAIHTFEDGQLRQLVQKAMNECAARSESLGRELSQ
ncbi:pyrroline-5-carboxylate reductase [Gilvimarinus chinensis]|uniref:pyrroline-5-carboxylate reductase n=1 Tax=Gilvimarinus chinensis TaxID=396005 RepID=UPI0003634D63|nr:pyrroline-5-carboxylate reductase [Gilvimarinus chinensis]